MLFENMIDRYNKILEEMHKIDLALNGRYFSILRNVSSRIGWMSQFVLDSNLTNVKIS